ncbi:MarR family transcriptional regulator [Chloroflexales bacterium ZM16-3]|nr:MarR family transcriptional regulator [Chloroflexales bacterium ZM16-3]
MTHQEQRSAYVTGISDVVRQITWQSQKQLLKTLSRPDIGLTMPQMVTLFAIRNAQTCRMSELADITQQSAGTLTGIVDRLIDDNLVGRVRDVEDRRVVQVTLTSAGEERVTLVEQARHEDMDRMLQHFDLGQLGDLECLLRLLISGLHEMISGEEPVTTPSHHPVITPLRMV